ncbi:hypothetical protein LS68_008925 [Helicobacter sp. MIT 05-5293]|uniref:hypothetical protein n=1 Tax=Helicobacter sp. MIT 05-5293 TaxID=1548149 RepID=UPI00051D6246|nr:hypothetical protein [Helicobacter sp. MIT 05-5293]TLD79952.1 hypothetical protein LS68_008925 [Helicobacter sp. MIT 05-5293]
MKTTLKTNFLALALCLSLGFNEARANMPVIDISSIAQSILSYTQQIQEFVKYEAELRAMGIDTGRVGSILQKIDNIGNNIINGINNTDFDNPYALLFEKINEHCEFLKKHDLFKQESDLAEKAYEDKEYNEQFAQSFACTDTLNKPITMIGLKDELKKQANEFLKNKDYAAYKEVLDNLKRVKMAQEFVKEQVTDKKLQTWGNFYKKFLKNKPNIKENVKTLIESATKSQNPTEVANTANAILAQMLELAMIQYEMSTQSNDILIGYLSQEQDRGREQISQADETFVDKANEAVSKLIKEEAFANYQEEVKYNEAGLPIMFE